MLKESLLKFLTFYQKFLTLFSYGSCRYYPTCSEYMRWRVEKENIFKALIVSTFRILRCNQLFSGGIDYPVVKKKFDHIEYKKIDVKFWFVPKGANRYILIKKF